VARDAGSWMLVEFGEYWAVVGRVDSSSSLEWLTWALDVVWEQLSYL
jgi:hypothetical protein